MKVCFIKHLLFFSWFFFFPFTQACPKWSLSSFSISFLFQNNRSNRIEIFLFRLEINLLDSSFLFCSHFSNCIFTFVRQLSETQNQSFNASSSSLLFLFSVWEAFIKKIKKLVYTSIPNTCLLSHIFPLPFSKIPIIIEIA